MPSTSTNPTLPQNVSDAQRQQRQFDLSLARTNYNYMQSYLEGVPMSADLPSTEKFSLDFEAQVLKVILRMMNNFSTVVLALLKKELESDLPTDAIKEIERTLQALKDDFSLLHPKRDEKELKAFIDALAALPAALAGIVNIPQDLAKMATGLKQVFDEALAQGPTAFLKSTLYDMLSETHGRNYLQARSEADYQALFATLELPMMLQLQQQDWMVGTEKPCQQDWFFGHLQIAGFNTTNICRVVSTPVADSRLILWSDLNAKMPITDSVFRAVTGSTLSLLEAIAQNLIYAVDFSQFSGATSDILHGQQRYITAPIALFYWNATPPKGYPKSYIDGVPGVLQPVCIQLGQKFDAESCPIFTPNDSAGANDPNLLKWRIAKYIFNALTAIQHEAVAHLGDCHLIIEPIVVASHRQLSTEHPLLKLLIPHFRFTININDDAIHSLIVPGGVVATNVGPSIESTRALIAQSHRDWRWDQNCPDQLFSVRGVDLLPAFPFRDDTRLLWTATKEFVGAYLRTYYTSDADVSADNELQGWVQELVDPRYCGFKGLNGLSVMADGTVKLDRLDYLIEMVSHIVYRAGPQHASVNYAQYPLMSYMPSVAGTIYQAPPTRSTVLKSVDDCLAWYPPLDVALYTFSFEYLLSEVQYDTFGHYEMNKRQPYFTDDRVKPLVADFQDALALIEIEIRKRNRERPIPYPFQLPSMIPNSVSI